MVIEQTSFLGGLASRFEFADADLGFTQIARGTGSSIAYRVRYTDIPRDATSITIPNSRAIRAIYLAGLIVAVATWRPAQIVPLLGWVVGFGWLAALLTVRRRGGIRLTQFNTKMGRLQIIRDRKAERVMSEIELRRKQAFLSHYEGMDVRAPGNRNALFWLQQQGYLTEEEFRVRLAVLDKLTGGARSPIEETPAPSLLN